VSEEITREPIPVVEETVTIDKRQRVKAVVRAKTETHEDVVVVDEPTLSEQVEVERVAIGRFIGAPVPVRQEGDTTIIPVFEEVVVVEKRLKLVEEVRLTKRQTTKHQPQTITLRRQEAVVERLPGPASDPHQDN
jgi:stress response protein YsnF